MNDKYQYVEKAPVVAPGVVDKLDEYGNFICRLYDGRKFDENGEEQFDE